MTFEVCASRPGELRMRDVRAALEVEVSTVPFIDVVVLGGPGSAPFVGRVWLGRKQSGRGEHTALLCGRCSRSRNVLRVDRRGRLECSFCFPKRTRQQREKDRTTWRQGDREEDQLLRLVENGRARLPAGLVLARRLAREVVDGDRDRFEALLPKVDAALQATVEEIQ